MTLDSVEVDCQQIFKPGQLGVAMSRVRDKEGLRVINFTPKVCLPQPDDINGYLMTPTALPVADCSCCKSIERPPDETVETFWFDDEIEADVPVTEDDLEDDFNSVIASLNVGESTNQQQLPDWFEMDQILNECITEVTVTAVQEQAGVLARSLLSDDQHYCKSFCITQFEEISKILSALEATPGTPIRADKVTEVETEILRYKRSDKYRVSCLLMFAKHHDFSSAHSFICTTLTDGVSKFLLHGKTKPYREKERIIHARVITDASRARIRYVAGYCVSKLLK